MALDSCIARRAECGGEPSFFGLLVLDLFMGYVRVELWSTLEMGIDVEIILEEEEEKRRRSRRVERVRMADADLGGWSVLCIARRLTQDYIDCLF